MRSVILAAVVALALARPHPHPPRDEISRSMEREKRAEIAEALRGNAAKLHSVNRKAAHTKGKAKPVDPEVLEKAREQAEREAKAAEETKRQSEAFKRDEENKLRAKAKLENDMKSMHQSLNEATSTTTTTAGPIDPHILDIPEKPENKTKPAPPTPAELAKMAEEKSEKEEHVREAEAAAKKQRAAEKKAEAEAKQLKEDKKRLHTEAQELKKEGAATGISESAVEKDEAAAKKLMKEVGEVAKPAIEIAKPVSLAPPEKKVEVSQAVQQADAKAKALLKTKTHALSKAAMWRTQQEIESEARSTSASLHAAAMDAESKRVEADMKEQMEQVKEVRVVQKEAMELKKKEDAEARKAILSSGHPHQLFRPKPFNPKAPEEVEKRAIDADARREGGLQDKMKDMMSSMEDIRAQIGH